MMSMSPRGDELIDVLETYTLTSVMTGQATFSQAMEEAAVDAAVEEAAVEEAATEEVATEEAATKEAATEEAATEEAAEPFDVGVQCYLLPTTSACKGRNVTVCAVLSKAMYYVQLGNSSRFQNVPRERLRPIRASDDSVHEKQRKEKERNRSRQRRAQHAQQIDWTLEEEIRLLEAMANCDLKPMMWRSFWSAVCHAMHGRLVSECRARWVNHLSPEASKKYAATSRLRTQRPSRPALLLLSPVLPSQVIGRERKGSREGKGGVGEGDSQGGGVGEACGAGVGESEEGAGEGGEGAGRGRGVGEGCAGFGTPQQPKQQQQ